MKNRIENWLFKIARYFDLIKYRKVFVPRDAVSLNEAAYRIRSGMAGPYPSWFNRYYIAIEGYHETSEDVFFPSYTGIYIEDNASLIGKKGPYLLFDKPPGGACFQMGEIGNRP